MIKSSYYSPAPPLLLLVQSVCVKKTSWGSCTDLFSPDLKLQPFFFQHCPWHSLFWEKKDALNTTSGVWSGSEGSDSLSGAKSAAGQAWLSFRQGSEREAQRGHLNVLFFASIWKPLVKRNHMFSWHEGSQGKWHEIRRELGKWSSLHSSSVLEFHQCNMRDRAQEVSNNHLTQIPGADQ